MADVGRYFRQLKRMSVPGLRRTALMKNVQIPKTHEDDRGALVALLLDAKFGEDVVDEWLLDGGE